MSTNYTFELVGRTPANIKMVQDTLFDIKESMFNNLYDAQRALADIDRYDFVGDETTESFVYNNTTPDPKINFTINEYECVFHIDKPLISHEQRSVYKSSSYYNKFVSLATVNSHPKIFTKSILIFINGKMYTDVYLKPSEDFTDIKFVFKSLKYKNTIMTRDLFVETVLAKDNKMTVIFLPNYTPQSIHHNITLDTLLQFSYENNNRKFPLLAFTGDSKSTNNLYQMLLFPDVAVSSNNNFYIQTDNDFREFLPNESTACFNILNLKNRLTPVTRILYNRYFELPLLNLPIPVENIFVFKRTSWFTMEFVHNPNILKLHYPNVYEITDFDKDAQYVVYANYSDNTNLLGTRYKNELALYTRFVGNIAEKLNNGTASDYIKTFKPVSMVYNNDDYTKKSYEYSDPIHYQFEKLKEMIYKDGDNYKFYLDKLVGYVPQYYINTIEIDLSKRLRTNNHKEIAEVSDQITFDEECYLFIVRLNYSYDKYMIWVDNHIFTPKYVNDNGTYKFIYIPKRLINSSGSIITIEQLSASYYKKSFVATQEYIPLTFDKTNNIAPNDIFLSVVVDGVSMYVDESEYTLYYKTDNIYNEITEGNSFFKYDELYIKMTNTTYIGTTITANVVKDTFCITNCEDNEFIVNREINNDPANFILVKNGSVVPNQAMQILFSDNVAGPHHIKVLLRENEDDNFALYYTPNKYYQVYYQSELNSGYINLTGKISKPLDFKWYDIYLNGRRLTENNVDIIGPYMMIIHDVESRRNLTIYQRNLDPFDMFVNGDVGNDSTDTLINNDKELKDVLEGDSPELPNIQEDILADLIIDYIGFIERYVYSLGLINPDKQQLTDEIIMDYPTIFDSNNNLFINPDVEIKSERSAFINPDIEGMIIK